MSRLGSEGDLLDASFNRPLHDFQQPDWLSEILLVESNSLKMGEYRIKLHDFLFLHHGSSLESVV